MEWLRSRIRRSPKTALAIGKTVFLAGAILTIGAVFARAGLAGVNADRAKVKLPPLHALSEAYPQYPTWFVPEGPIGFSIAAVLILVGMAVTVWASEAVKRRGPGVQ